MRVTEIQNAILGIANTANADKPFRLTITDTDTKELIWVDIPAPVVEQIVKKLTSGIQIAATIPAKLEKL